MTTRKPITPGIRALVASHGGSPALVAAAERVDAEERAALVAKPRGPVKGWRVDDGRLVLEAGPFIAKVRDHGHVDTFGNGATWAILLAEEPAVTVQLAYAADERAAQLAAEDALIALLRPAAEALGYAMRKA